MHSLQCDKQGIISSFGKALGNHRIYSITTDLRLSPKRFLRRGPTFTFTGDIPDSNSEPPLDVMSFFEFDTPSPKEGGPRATLLQHSIRDVVAQDQLRPLPERIDRVHVKNDAWKEHW
jgi:hypothetical protein